MYFLKYIKLSPRLPSIGRSRVLQCLHVLQCLFMLSVYIIRFVYTVRLYRQVLLFIVQAFRFYGHDFIFGFCSIKLHLPRRQTCEQQNVGTR